MRRFRGADALVGATTWLLLLAACIAVPILLVTMLFIRDVDRSIDFARRERIGLARLAALGDIARDASRYRTAFACRSGASPNGNQVERDLAVMDGLERQYPLVPGEWSAAEATWRARPEAARAGALSDAVSPLFVLVSDRSGLTFDPETVGINLADALAYRLPRGLHELEIIAPGTCRGHGASMPARLLLAGHAGTAAAFLADAFSDVEQAVDPAPGPVSRVATAALAARIRSNLALTWLARFESRPEAAVARTAQLRERQAEFALYGLNDALRPALETILSRRFVRLERRFYLTLIPGIVAMFGAVLFVLVGARGILQRAELERIRRSASELGHHATHDALTSLPNRAAFVAALDEVLAEARVRGGVAAVLFIDLDNFKLINDSLGHAAGDDVLCSVSQKLEAIREEAGAKIAARFGGDEFAMLVADDVPANISTRIDVVVKRIVQRLSEPVTIGTLAQDVVVSASIGIALVEDPRDGEVQAADLLRNADVAMYEAKAGGPAQAATFGPAMHARAARKLLLTTELREAAQRNEFSLELEPIVRLSDGVAIGREALIRWNHPLLGNVPPSAFIPVAEESASIVRIGRWVLGAAVRELAQDASGGFLHVNLAVKDLVEDSLESAICGLLEEYDVRPAALAIEITEGSLVRSGGRAEATLRRFRALGIKVWIDDFGVEYSSLRYLHRLPIDGVKIDRTFVGGANGELASPSIVRMIVELAASLNFEVIAEGIETVRQRDALVALGCAAGQGYFFTRAAHRAPAVPATKPAEKGLART